MLTKEQKLVMVTFVFHNKAKMIGSLTPSCTNRDRKEKWEELRSLLISHGLPESVTAEALRTTEWQNVRRGTVEKFRKLNKSGAEGGKLAQFEEVLMDIIGRESAHVKAVPVEDMAITKKSQNQSPATGPEAAEEKFEVDGIFYMPDDVPVEVADDSDRGILMLSNKCSLKI
jgi:hypothetical protein